MIITTSSHINHHLSPSSIQPDIMPICPLKHKIPNADEHRRRRPPSAHPPDAGQRGRRWTQTQLPPPATPGVIFLSQAQVSV